MRFGIACARAPTFTDALRLILGSSLGSHLINDRISGDSDLERSQVGV
jgi:hypothetical protein